LLHSASPDLPVNSYEIFGTEAKVRSTINLLRRKDEHQTQIWAEVVVRSKLANWPKPSSQESIITQPFTLRKTLSFGLDLMI
jgi:hypothetical protein